MNTTNRVSSHVEVGTLGKSIAATWLKVKGNIYKVAKVNIHLFTVNTEYFLISGLNRDR